jgi:alkylhydroperoxidase family enzyme
MSGLPRAGVPKTTTGHIIRDSSLGLVVQTLDPILKLQSLLWGGAPLRPALVEMLRLRSARAVNCVICKAVRYDVARQDGLTEDKVAQLGGDYASSDFTEEEKLVVAFADAYLNQPQRIDERLRAALVRTFTPAQLCHMAIAIAFFNPMSKCAVSLGGMPESFPLTEISVPSR